MSSGAGELTVTGLAGSADAFAAARTAILGGRPVVVLAADDREAERLSGDIAFFLGPEHEAPVIFPAYTIMPYRPVAYHNKTAAARLALLFRLTESAPPPVMVVTLAGIMQRLLPRAVLRDYAELVMAGEALDLEAFREKLLDGGYTHTALVEEPGDFSVRGGILDVFSPLYPEPIRIELFGDMVENLRFFSPVTQRRKADIAEAITLPARETVFNRANSGRMIAAVKKQAALMDLPLSESRKVIDRFNNRDSAEGLESLLPLFYEDLATLFDYLPDRAGFFIISPDTLRERAAGYQQQLAVNYEAAREQNRLCLPPDSHILDWTSVEEALAGYPRAAVRHLDFGEEPPGASAPGSTAIRMNTTTREDLKAALSGRSSGERTLAPLAKWMEANRENQVTSVIASASRSQAERLAELLRPYRAHPVITETMADVRPGTGAVFIVIGDLSTGFEDAANNRLSLLCDSEIIARRPRRVRKSSHRARTRFLELEDLKKGDLVVHADYGIGQYQGIVDIKVEGIRNDFLLITYKDGDRLYLSVDRMDLVKKYVGVDGVEPVLDKMGGASWERAKAKAKKEVEKIAKDLLKLYARRKVSQGHAFAPPEEYYQEFAAGFPYDETGDQRQVIEEVLADMASFTPMDRLVCGDVGYGKTEIVMRAAFVAVCDGRQVAVLVPTTVLAEQHLATFQQRFADFPVTIACLNRFRSPAEQKRIVADVKAGRVDIVIGTHRLLSADVSFSDLGLVVLDEEQRFGVKHKEALKKLRHTVDVLSLTATPIPRTLHMSLMGVRDISIINTPPENRLAIQTYVSEFDDGIVAAAIRRELARGGQIYFVHNNINKIWAIANRLQKLVPEVRLGVAHGRLDKNELEAAMMKFINREIDMLVCTRIIESGLDIPSANTIFVNRADRFGLAQIYQLRGRVGRAGEQAYAYLFIPKESALGTDARKRLKVLMEHSDLGSGFRIAMSDLQIRGGGSALGVSQSGHIAAVGYDMFLQLMERTVSELKGEPAATPLEPEINVPLSAHIDDAYIPAIDQRLAVYRQLSRARTNRDITAVRDELIDRYGPLPEETENLLLKIMLKVLSTRAGVSKLDLSEKELVLQFSPAHLDKDTDLASSFSRITDRHEGTGEFAPVPRLRVGIDAKKGRQAVVAAKKILKELGGHGTTN
ncbi:MAG: transcription-repair coupling factor [Desulfosudaceae bacterium]